MSDSKQPTPDVPDQLIADLNTVMKRIQSIPDGEINTKKLLCFEIIPAMKAMVERMVEIDEVVEEFVDQQGSYIQEDQAKQLLTTLALGAHIVEEVQKNMDRFDDMTKHKLNQMIRDFQSNTELSYMIIQEAAVTDDESDGSSSSSSSSGDGYDDYEEEEIEPPPEPPQPEMTGHESSEQKEDKNAE